MDREISRRHLLTRGWRWALGAIGLAGAWTSWDLLQPLPAAGFGGKVRTVPPAAIPDGGVLEIPTARAYLTKIDGEVAAIWWKCTHLGCKVPWCNSSSEFECPCHGSVFNRVGEYRAGPAPRGLDRFAVEIVDGFVEIDTGTVITGPAPGPESINEPPTGPQCLDLGTES